MKNALDVAEEALATPANLDAVHDPRMMTQREWLAWKGGFCWVDIRFMWTDIHLEIAEKKALELSTGWVYRHGKRFIFEKEGDRALFILWAQEKIVMNETGEF